MPVFSFSKVNRIIGVATPDTEVTIQQLINAIRDWEDELVNLEVAKVADATGKENLGGGLAVGITLKLLNWKVKFADRSGPSYVDCGVSGGNLVAVDASGDPMNPIAPAAYVTVTVSKAVSAAIVQDADIDAIKAKTDNLPSDPATQSLVTTVHTSLDEAKHAGGTFERDKESLEAIRARLDEVYEKPSGGRGFTL